MNAETQTEFYALLFSELRLIPVTPLNVPLSEERLVCAVTANEEFAAAGYTLSPADVVLLSRAAELDAFPQLMHTLIPAELPAPMYPGFPKQVMEMDEAVFRFHQMLHYLSTYGIEALTGEQVLRGWLPETADAAVKDQEPAHLLKARVVSLIDSAHAAETVFARILTKNERMTDKERMLIALCLPELTAAQIAAVTVTFKENLVLLFSAVANSQTLSAAARLDALQAICRHTGDVWKCLEFYLKENRFHFRTSQKRMLVRLFERYPAEDFRANLMLSNLKREQILSLLTFLSYNDLSRSPAHKEAVRLLRSGALHSWQSDALRRIRTHAPDTLEFIAQRPGMMLRMMTLLLRNGYSAEDIAAHLRPQASALRTQTLVTMLNCFDSNTDDPVLRVRFSNILHIQKRIEDGDTLILPENLLGRRMVIREREQLDEALQIMRERAKTAQRRITEYPILTQICSAVLEEKLRAAETPIRGRRVAFRFGDIAPEFSVIRTNDKSDEGGYIPSGAAYRIPEGVSRIRFFVYWNDKARVDVDLHTTIRKTDNSVIHGGWNADFKADCMAFSGDITHSNAAEYMDIDLSKGEVAQAFANIHLYCHTGVRGRIPAFRDIETCYVGCMAVNTIGENVKLYSPANCFFVHHLTSQCSTLQYGYVDAVKRCVTFLGQPLDGRDWYGADIPPQTNFSLQKYLEILCRAQGAEIVPEAEAETVLVMGKPESENEISLRDNNYFMDAEAAP